MSQDSRRTQTGSTLQRVRTLQERLAQARAADAQAKVDLSLDDLSRRDGALARFEGDMLAAARAPLPASDFLRAQSMRALHVDAACAARDQHKVVCAEADARRVALSAAVQRRRQADRLIEIAADRRAIDRRRREQHQTDDSNCARAALGAA